MHNNESKYWVAEDKDTVSQIYCSQNCKGGLIQLEYKFVSEMNPDSSTPENEPLCENIYFTPSMDANISNLLKNFDDKSNDHLAVVNHCNNPSNILNSLDEDSFPNPISISDQFERIQDTLPATPFKASNSLSSNDFDDLSRDGFSPIAKIKVYEGKCREYWYQLEQSVDYSTFFTQGKRKRKSNNSNEPKPKKQRLIS